MAKSPVPGNADGAERSPPIEAKWYEKPFAVITAVVVFAGAVVALCSWTYSVGKDAGEKQLAVYETTQKLDLPKLSADAIEATAALKTATDEFITMLVDNRTYAEMKDNFDKLTAERNSLNGRIQDLEAATKSLQTELDKANQRVASLTPSGEINTLRVGQSYEVYNQITLGLVTHYGSSVQLKINSENGNYSNGDVIDVPGLSGGDCQVTILNLDADEKTVEIRVTCSS